MVKVQEIKSAILNTLEGAEVIINDFRGDEMHFEVVVVSSHFAGKSLLEQHQIVMQSLRHFFGSSLHACRLETYTPNEWGGGERVRDVQQEIRQDIKLHPVILFMKGSPEEPRCKFSAQACEILSRRAPHFETRDVLQDETLREGIKAYSNWPTLPQLYIRGQFVGGCDIIVQLDARGELQKLLDANNNG